MQPRTTAKGYCTGADAFTFARRFFWTDVPARNRLFPSFKASSALDGVMAACDSLVWTTEALAAGLAATFGSSGNAITVEAMRRKTEIQRREEPGRITSPSKLPRSTLQKPQSPGACPQTFDLRPSTSDLRPPRPSRGQAL